MILRGRITVPLLCVVTAVLLVSPLPSDAQRAKVPTIGVLAPSAGRNPIDIADTVID